VLCVFYEIVKPALFSFEKTLLGKQRCAILKKRDAFAQKKLHRVEAYCHPDNVNSWHLPERLGFKREAHLRRDIWFGKDEAGAPIWQDTYIYGLLEEDLGK